MWQNEMRRICEPVHSTFIDLRREKHIWICMHVQKQRHLVRTSASFGSTGMPTRCPFGSVFAFCLSFSSSKPRLSWMHIHTNHGEDKTRQGPNRSDLYINIDEAFTRTLASSLLAPRNPPYLHTQKWIYQWQIFPTHLRLQGSIEDQFTQGSRQPLCALSHVVDFCLRHEKCIKEKTYINNRMWTKVQLLWIS